MNQKQNNNLKPEKKTPVKKRRFRKLRIMLWVLAIFIFASLLSLYSYGRFAANAKGAEGYALPIHASQTKLDRLLEPLTQAHLGETGLILLQDNLDAFMVRALTAREAERSLDLQYYIWHDDLTGQLLDLEILKAADRGVRVRMILDDMTAHGRESALAAMSLHPNIEIRLFNPSRHRENSLLRGSEMLLRLFTMNRRMHNKAWIADNRMAIVGGRNIGDEYFDASEGSNFFDMDMLLTGQAVGEASTIFDDFWNSTTLIPLGALVTVKPHKLDELRTIALKRSQELEASPYVQRLQQTSSVQALYKGERPVYWSKEVHVYSDPASKGLGHAKDQWLISTLHPLWLSSQSEFKIISPYFVPGNDGVKDFANLTTRGVEVSILTNSLAATDVIASHSGYAPYRKALLEEGVNLYELKPFSDQKQKLFGSSGASLHTKAFIIDNQTAFVGSFNFDPRSANLNTEMGVIFKDPAVIAQLAEEFSKRTSGQYSYKLELIGPPINSDNEIIWVNYYNDTIENPDKENASIFETDPESPWYKRATATFLGWLPIEWLL